MLFSKTKDELRYQYGIIRCGAAIFDQIEKAEVLAYRKDDYQWNVLVADKEKARRKYKNAVVDDATIDDILLLYVRRTNQMKSLILKDLYNVGHNAKSMLFILVVLAVALISTSGVTEYIFMCAILCSMMIITTFSFDDNSKWARYAMIMFVSFLLPAAICFGLYQLLVWLGVEFTDQLVFTLLCFSPIIALIWCYVMYQISYRIFSKQEL